MAYIYNLQVDSGTDYALSIWSPLPGPSVGYMDFSTSAAEFRAQCTSLAGVVSTTIDISSTTTTSVGSLALGSSDLTVYDTSSSPSVTLTIPTNHYWVLTLPKATTIAQAGNELVYQFDVITEGVRMRPATGSMTFSCYIPPVGS